MIGPGASSSVDPFEGDEEGGSRDGDGWVSRQVAALVAAWDRSEPVTAAEILRDHPDLDDEAAIRLIYEEACLRREAGEPVDTAEVVRLHPDLEPELRALFACDRLLRPSGAPAERPEVGESLGPFLLLDELGRGASGRTYLATDPTLADRPVVVKVMADDQVEHLALAQLRHTHIVPLFSEHAFPDRGLRGLCMPYLGGASLDRILKDLDASPFRGRSGALLAEVIARNTRKAPAPPPADGPFLRNLLRSSYVEAVAWIASCLAEALHYAHERGLVHMDLKPSNVLITVDGQPMLLDFHLARGPIAAGSFVTDRLGGTPGWMSPEQEAAMDAVTDGRPVATALDGRTDIFALGLLMKEALGDYESPRGAFRRPPGVSVGLADIVRKCLATDPRDRYADASSLADDLRRELNDLPMKGVRNRNPAERLAKWRRRHPGALAWGVTLLTIASAAAGSVLLSRQRVAGLGETLEAGRVDRLAGRYDDAIRILTRGRQRAEGWPASSSLRSAFDEELTRAKRGDRAEQLHALADRVRFHYGVDLPPPEVASVLARLSESLWDKRRELLDLEPDSASGTRSRVATDLLELAVVRADLLLASSSDGATDVRKRALGTLDEARDAFGPSVAIDIRRDALLGTPAEGTDLAAKSEWEHYDLGRYDLRSGRIEEARGEFRATLERRPQDFWSNFYQGLCAFRLRDFADAEASFRTCEALAPGSAVCSYSRALALAALGRLDEADREYGRAMGLDPKFAQASLNRGVLKLERGRHAEAIAHFEEALRAAREPALRGQVLYNLAIARRDRGDRAAARDAAREALLLGNDEARTLLETLR